MLMSLIDGQRKCPADRQWQCDMTALDWPARLGQVEILEFVVGFADHEVEDFRGEQRCCCRSSSRHSIGG
jgi:hypothetical protein